MHGQPVDVDRMLERKIVEYIQMFHLPSDRIVDDYIQGPIKRYSATCSVDLPK